MKKINLKNLNVVRDLVKGKDMYAFCQEVPENVKEKGYYEPFSFIELSIYLQDEVFVGYSQVQLSTVNRESPYLEESVKKEMVVTYSAGKVSSAIIERFNRAYISLIVKDGQEFLNNPIYFYGKSYYMDYLKEGVMRSLYTGNLVPEEQQEMIREKGICYGYDKLKKGACCSITSNGNLKQNKILLYATTNVEGFDNQTWSHIIHGGMYKELLNVTGKDGKKCDLKTLSQSSTRLAQPKAFMAECGETNCYAILFGKFSYSSDKEQDFEYADGHGFYNVDVLTQQINNRINPLGFEVRKKNLLGVGIQARPLTTKCFWLSVQNNTINNLLKEYEVVHYFVETDGEEMREEFIKALKKDKSSSLWGKVVIVHTKNFDLDEKVGFFTDMNGFKAPYWPETVAYANILEMTHEDHDEFRKCSTQLYKTIKLANPKKATELFMERISEAIDKKIESLLSEEKKDLSSADLVGDLMSAFSKLRPDMVNNELASMYRKEVENTFQGFKRDIFKLGFPMQGTYDFMIPELSLMFCKERLLGVKEIYVPDFTGEVAVIKNPKMGNHEFGIYTAITKEEYKSRAEKVMTKQKYILFCELLDSLAISTVICPAYSIVLKLHAGADFDGDKIFVITDKKIVEIMKEAESIPTICL